MSETEIADLFNHGRVALSGVENWLAFIFYFPFGLVLFVIRLFIAIQAVIIARLIPGQSAAKRYMMRVICCVLGIVVFPSDESMPITAKILVSNWSSALHHLAIGIIYPCVQPCVWDLPRIMLWLFGYTEMGAKHGKDTLVKNAKAQLNKPSSYPLLAFPEGATTSGERGLLKFSCWPFSLDSDVQPVLVQANRPAILPVKCVVVGGRWWQDLFWTLFVPYTSYHIRTLPPVEQTLDEDPEDYAQRVQFYMAQQLNVVPTQFTIMDKVEYTKRYLFRQPVTETRPESDSSPSPSNSETSVKDKSLSESTSSDPLAQLVQQVKDVLPDVPTHVIRQDLAVTNDVDLTLQNILEGSVNQSIPPVVPPVETPRAVVFPKSSSQRQMSLEERKKALLDGARHRYKIRHSLQS